MKLRWKWVGLVGILLVGLEVLYLAVGNWALHNGTLAHLLSRKPERFQIEWSSGRTIWPGVIHLRGVSFRGQSDRLQTYAQMDRCTIHMYLSLLAACRVHFSSVRCEGLSLWIRHRREPGKPWPLDRFEPPIPGLEQDDPPPRQKRYPSPWILHFGSVNIADAREIWIGPYKITGRGRAEGGMSYRLRGPLAVRRGVLWMDGARVALGEEVLASGVEAVLDARIDSLVPRKHRGRPFLRFVSGRYQARGHVASLGFLNEAFGKRSPLYFTGRGHLLVDATVNRGVLERGSSLSFEGEELGASVAGFWARGKGSISGGTGSAGDSAGQAVSLLARWTDITVTREGPPSISLDGPGLTTTMTGPELDLASDGSDLLVELDLPDSGIQDLSVLRDFLPSKFPLTILPGSAARVRGHFDIRDKRPKGSLSLVGKDVGVGIGGHGLRGLLKAEIVVADGDLDTKVLDISGSKIAFRDGTISAPSRGPQGGPWNGEAHLSGATLRLTVPASLHSTVALTMKDARPLIAVLSPNHKAVRWLLGLLKLENLTGRGLLDTDGRITILKAVEMRGTDMQMLAHLRIEGGRTNGAFYAELHRYSAAALITDGKRDWKLTNARQWYESQPGF